METISYSLGDAIDWKLKTITVDVYRLHILLLARGRDRLETEDYAAAYNPAIQALLLARGRDRLETQLLTLQV